MKRHKEINDAIGFTSGKRSEDRLTNLPSCLRTKILSCLSTKDAVATNILSTQWKWSWTSLTNLDFDDSLVKLPHTNADFTRFVCRVLLLRDRSCLQRVCMKCSQYYKGSLINTRISAVLLYNVKELDLYPPFIDRPLSPYEIFLCKSLVVLKLDTRGNVIIPASVSLPALKTLHILKVRISDDVSFARLFSGCPVLEELVLSLCVGNDVHVLNINSPVLTSLTLEYLIYWTPDSDYNSQVVIDTPSLKYLYCNGYVQGYVFKNLNNLIKAEIHSATREDKEEETTGLFTDLFSRISQVHSLVLSHMIEDINWCQVAVPTFSNLTYLEIDYAPKKLLENSPCLKTLHIRKGSPYKIDETELQEYRSCFLIDDVPPSCFLSGIKVIKFDKFKGLNYEKLMIEYFLRNAKVLEKLTIRYRSSFGVDDAKQLLMLPRSSTICTVEIL